MPKGPACSCFHAFSRWQNWDSSLGFLTLKHVSSPTPRYYCLQYVLVESELWQPGHCVQMPTGKTELTSGASEYRGSSEITSKASILCKVSSWCVSSVKMISLSQNRRVCLQQNSQSLMNSVSNKKGQAKAKADQRRVVWSYLHLHRAFANCSAFLQSIPT